jgi:hypothetical protein
VGLHAQQQGAGGAACTAAGHGRGRGQGLAGGAACTTQTSASLARRFPSPLQPVPLAARPRQAWRPAPMRGARSPRLTGSRGPRALMACAVSQFVSYILNGCERRSVVCSSRQHAFRTTPYEP